MTEGESPRRKGEKKKGKNPLRILNVKFDMHRQQGIASHLFSGLDTYIEYVCSINCYPVLQETFSECLMNFRFCE